MKLIYGVAAFCYFQQISAMISTEQFDIVWNMFIFSTAMKFEDQHHSHVCTVNMWLEPVSVALNKDWKQGETDNMTLSKKNQNPPTSTS